MTYLETACAAALSPFTVGFDERAGKFFVACAGEPIYSATSRENVLAAYREEVRRYLETVGKP